MAESQTPAAEWICICSFTCLWKAELKHPPLARNVSPSRIKLVPALTCLIRSLLQNISFNIISETLAPMYLRSHRFRGKKS